MEQKPKKERVRGAIEAFSDGRDEMNLAEFPLSGIADRFHDGQKTLVFEDQVWDEQRREHLPRKLSISGSDLYGLPTAKDDDVLLACVQLSALGDFHNREVHFSRYELLKLLRWADSTRNYRRVAESLRRWKGLTIYSDRAFYDHAHKSWVNRDFGIIDNLYLYEREESDRARAPAKSRFIWNEVMYSSFQAGYIKRLDWELYLSLKDPVAKRLYRLLDKRFYRGDRVSFDLHELAFNKIRVSKNYNTAQIKRALMNGIRELEALWELRKMPLEDRFRKVNRGQWEVVFAKRRKRAKQVVREEKQRELAVIDLEVELARRGVGPAAAEELVGGFPVERIKTMIELYDWHNARGQERGAGFLVAGIKSKQAYLLPKGFESSAQRETRKRASKSRKRAERKIEAVRERKKSAGHRAAEEAFAAFWSTLNEEARERFECDALAAANPTKRDCYRRAQVEGGLLLETYRGIVLRDYFEQTNVQTRNRDPVKPSTARTNSLN